MLIKLLATAKDTDFGKFYHFQDILDSKDPANTFSDVIPHFDYNKVNKEWWHRLQDGDENVTWPGQPSYFALSSSTTGKSSKRIPVTGDMIETINNTGIQQVFSLSKFDFPANFYEKEIMMFRSSTELKKKNNQLEGEISGISASNIPFWFRGC